MHCVLSSQDDPIVVISRIQARFSACFMKVSWVQLKFFWAYCFLQKKERHCPFMFGEKGWRAETQKTSGCISWLDEKMPFCLSWGNVIILTVIGEPKSVSWAEECVLLEDGLENHQQDGSFKEKMIDHIKKIHWNVYLQNYSVTPLLWQPGYCPGPVNWLCTVIHNWLRSGVLQALVLSSYSNLVTVKFQAKYLRI